MKTAQEELETPRIISITSDYEMQNSVFSEVGLSLRASSGLVNDEWVGGVPWNSSN